MGIKQRRGVNFMGNSYMGWRKKGKGFLSRKGAGGSSEVERWPSGSLNLFLPLTPVPLHLSPAFVFRVARFWLTISSSYGP
jgi:hypothetical protein